MPAILSKLKDNIVSRASHVNPGVALGVGVGVALAACALYGSRDKKLGVIHNTQNNNNYKLANGAPKDSHSTACGGDGPRCGRDQCALCRGVAECDNRQTIESEDDTSSTTSGPEEETPGLNAAFLRQLLSLIRIMVPRAKCREVGLLSVHTMCLFTRTFLSIYVASLEGSIVKYIVKKDLHNFSLMLLQWFGIAIPATFINSMIRYLESKLALSFRTRLVNHAYEAYFKNQTYYRVSNLDGRIENPDHRLTDDVSVFAASCAHLYGHLTKPCFDLLLIALTLARYSTRMKANIFVGPAIAVAVVGGTGQALRMLSPRFGALAGEEARRKAALRHVHSRLIAHAEEVAFYGGHKVELEQLQSAYGSLVSQMSSVYGVKLWYVMLEQFFMKYVWSGTGMVMLALPILTGGKTGGGTDGISARTEYLTTSRNLLSSAADAVERLLSSYKEVVTLAGYASRVADMLRVFEEVAAGHCVRASHCDTPVLTQGHFAVTFHDGQPVPLGKVIYTNEKCIRLRDVPIVTPACDVVASGVTLDIEPGRHLLITGPNGCGKSSLFRIISGLWPVYGGELEVPRPCSCRHCADGYVTMTDITMATDAGVAIATTAVRTTVNGAIGDANDSGKCETRPIMFYIPQRPYMSIGTLMDQVTYPARALPGDTVAETLAASILRLVRLEHVARRHGGLRATRDWRATLSGGEKQRMAMARMFYHRPVYALLDECTSAVSMETELVLYEEAVKQGITLMSITHRPSVWKYHTHVLEFDGQGNWSFKPLPLALQEAQPSMSMASAIALANSHETSSFSVQAPGASPTTIPETPRNFLPTIEEIPLKSDQ